MSKPNPIIYLQEEQITPFFAKKFAKGKSIVGIAYSFDNDSVFHIHIKEPKYTPSGFSKSCVITFLPEGEILGNLNLLNNKREESKDSSLFIFFTLINDTLKHTSFLIKENKVINCDIKYIPERSELYSRSKGLLETGKLSQKTVGIVGLGSGGSPLAIELAKAGVGNFVLIDFDRLELSNVARHICGINDLGRFKTYAVKDAILQKNPHAEVSTLEIDVNEYSNECSTALSNVDLIMCASDNDRSRFLLNEIALKYKIPAIFGRAITRAIGGDVLRVRPFQGPCYSCLYSLNIRQEGGDDEEISQEKQAKKLLPDYTGENDIKTVIQVGLSSDIAPISNFMVKLALVELSRGIDSGIKSLEEDFIADFYIWANRREKTYENWSKLEYNFNQPTILRWYGARIGRDNNCMVCGN
jgi:molybdopterin/thiamine biosynthesis adenylyltransferase